MSQSCYICGTSNCGIFFSAPSTYPEEGIFYLCPDCARKIAKHIREMKLANQITCYNSDGTSQKVDPDKISDFVGEKLREGEHPVVFTKEALERKRNED